MKLYYLLNPAYPPLDAFVLSKEEYLQEHYHPMDGLGEQDHYLFLGERGNRRDASGVSLRRGSSCFVLLEATPEEEKNLWLTGYRMIGLNIKDV